MSYFIFDGNITPNQLFTLKGDEAVHLLNSRRIQIGEVIEVQDSLNLRYQARVEAVSKKELKLLPVSRVEQPPDSALKINLFQALVKDKALELILQKATELGVSQIFLFHSAFSQRLKKDTEKLLIRWHKICLEACKQSGRTSPPLLFFAESVKHLISMTDDLTGHIPTICFSTLQQTQKLENISIHEAVNILIGPEGGWQENELAELSTIQINLGQRVLRSETAAIAAITLLQFLFGDLTPQIN